MINRNIDKPVPAFTAVSVIFTCSTGDALSGAAVNGAVIDRLGTAQAGLPQITKGDFAQAAKPFAFAWTTVGSTAVVKGVTIDCKLQHGDSSGGGDMADLSTQDNAATRTYFPATLTTDMLAWTTQAGAYHSNVSDYQISSAKRFLRPVTTVTKSLAGATSTAAGSADFMYMIQGIILDEFPYAPPSPFSGTSATSTV